MSTTWRNVVASGVSFSELPLRTIRETVVEDGAGRELYAETAVCAAPDEYETVSWRGTERDSRGRAVRVSRSDGTAEETSWGCCLPESRTAADGTRTEYAYDSQKREVLRVEYAPGRPPRTTSTSYDAAGRVLSTTTTAEDNSPFPILNSQFEYDAAGRVVFERGPDGVPVRHLYSADGLTVATVRGEGESAVTNATVRQRDGRVARTLLNGAPRETYAYAPLSATLFTGPAGTNSPAFRTTRLDFLGRTAAEITPAFGGGLLVATNLYDARGLLASAKTLHLPASDVSGEHCASCIVHCAFRLHDALGNRVVEASDRDGDGLLSLATDAVTSNATAYAKIGGDWWEVSSSWTFPIEGSAEPVLSRSTRRRLTGLGSAGSSGGVGGSPATLQTSPSSGGAVARSATGGVPAATRTSPSSGGVGGSPATLLLSETVTADALGNETVSRRTLDPSTGLVTDETLSPASTNCALCIVHYAFSLGGLLVSNVTATGVTTLYGHDALGRKTSATDGRGNVTSYSYDERGNLVSETDAAGATTSYAYDALNRRTAIMHNAQCTMHNGGGGNPSTLQPFNSSTTFTAYDAEDRVIAQWGATYPVLYSYDAFGRLATLSTTRDDEAAGQLATDHWPLAADASGVAWDTTRWNYDEATGLLTNKLYADGLGPSYSYTPDGKLASRAWARGIVTAYAYDYAGNLTNVMQNAECTMHNGGDGNPVNPVNPVETTYTYDRVGHMLSAIVEGVSTNHYSYSIHGQLTNEVQNGVAIARTYDSLNRPTGYTLNPVNPVNPVEVNYSYDTLGRFSGVGFNAEAQRSRVDFEYSYLPGTYLVSGYTAGGFSRSVAYEPHRNLIAAITNSFTPAGETYHLPLSTYHYSNDSLGRRTAITRGGAAFGDLSGATDAYGYNLRSEVVSSRRTLADSPVRGFDYDYAYDPIGNRTSATDYDEQGNPLVSSYSANALNQYTQRTVPGYAAVRGEAATNATVTVNERPTFRQGSFFYGGDEADNTASAVCKDLEIYAAINPPGTNTPDIVSATTGTVFIARTPESFTYDADGNMTSDGRFRYFWNGENRLVMASNDTTIVTYAYDHRGRMVRKEISHEGTKTRRIEYLWDDWNIIRETTIDNCQTDYVWGLDLDGTLQGAGGVGGLLAVVRDDGVFLPTYDANGNVSEYISTNGEIVAHYDYSPFGEPLVASGELAAAFTHQFSTKPYCAVTGFSEYQMRKYNPEIGRWMSRDPIEEDGAWKSLYVLCGNMPLSQYDHLGEDSPNIGGSLLPREPPDKPRMCGMCCTNAEGKTGKYVCKWSAVPGEVTGGVSEWESHQQWKKMKPRPDRSGQTKWWNPTLCFEEPKCEEGWNCKNTPPLLIDKNTHKHLVDDAGNRRGSGGAPDHAGKGRICYELNTRGFGDWSWKGNHSNKELGVWCIKCISSN